MCTAPRETNASPPASRTFSQTASMSASRCALSHHHDHGDLRSARPRRGMRRNPGSWPGVPGLRRHGHYPGLSPEGRRNSREDVPSRYRDGRTMATGSWSIRQDRGWRDARHPPRTTIARDDRVDHPLAEHLLTELRDRDHRAGRVTDAWPRPGLCSSSRRPGTSRPMRTRWRRRSSPRGPRDRRDSGRGSHPPGRTGDAGGRRPSCSPRWSSGTSAWSATRTRLQPRDTTEAPSDGGPPRARPRPDARHGRVRHGRRRRREEGRRRDDRVRLRRRGPGGIEDSRRPPRCPCLRRGARPRAERRTATSCRASATSGTGSSARPEVECTPARTALAYDAAGGSPGRQSTKGEGDG